MVDAADHRSFLLRLSDALSPLANPDAVETTACRMLGEYLKLDYVVTIDLDGDEFAVRRGWCSHPPLPVTRGSMAAFGKGLMEATLRGEAIVVTNTATDERFTQEERNRLVHIRAILHFTRMESGKPVGAFAVHQRTPRAWTEADIWLLHGVAQRIWAAVERSRADTALRSTEEQLSAELASMQVLQTISGQLMREQNPQNHFELIVNAAAQLMGSDAAALQEYDRQGGRLKLVAARGFHPDAANHWEWLSTEATTSCAQALQCGRRVVVEDVRTFELAQKDRDAYALSGLQAMQSTPLVSHGGQVVGVLSTHWSRAYQPDARAYRAFDVLARWAADLLVRSQIEKALQDSEARQKALVAELQHRTRNIIAVVQSIAERSGASASSFAEFSVGFNHRLNALARVQGLLSRSNSQPITIGALVRMALEAVGFSAAPGRIHLAGPNVRLRSATVQTLALALHELTTNALKHGALGDEKGTLDVTWELRDEKPGRYLMLTWLEQGLHICPEQQNALSRGQGLELIELALPYSLGARTSFRLEETGAVCTIALPLDAPQMEDVAASDADGSKPRTKTMRLSARNQIKGRVADVKLGEATAHIRIDVGNGIVITSSITNDSVADLRLGVGDDVHAIIKASDVLVSK